MSLTGDGLLLVLAVFAMFFTILQMRRRHILIGLVAFIMWFSMGMWLFYGDSPMLSLGEVWVDILAWGFTIMAFVPLVFQLDIEIIHEHKGKRWTKYGEEPTIKGPSSYEAYRDKLFQKTRGRRRR